MCGIIGYTGNQQALPILMQGLNNLEYRGYDSAGLSIFYKDNTHETIRTQGKVVSLNRITHTLNLKGTAGIGHTRWATHGDPSIENAHPHTDSVGNLSVVHNGIVENHTELRNELINSGHKFKSDTDTETIPHLIESYMNTSPIGFEEAVIKSANRIKGANAIVIMSNDQPDTIMAVKLGNAGGLVIGIGDGEVWISSDMMTMAPHTNRIVHMESNEIAKLTPDSVVLKTLKGITITKTPILVANDPVSAAKGKFRHFMLKEIHEQPESLISTLSGRITLKKNAVKFRDLSMSIDNIKNIDKITLTGMGTSLHAAMIARLWIEKISGIPSEWDNSSEFRYRSPIINKNNLFISISQSGETADTLAAMEEISKNNGNQITLCNYPNTQSSRIANETLQIRAGLEIGVAASKTFTCSLLTLYLLAIHMGSITGNLSETEASQMISEISRLPELIGKILQSTTHYEKLADKFHNKSDFLFLGRGINYPMALEGALKLKEISYIHAEGYPAGEMKHGPISLIDENMPIVAIVPKDSMYDKMINNINEAKSRGGTIIAIASDNDTEIGSIADHTIYIPQCSELITPIIAAIPLQLLAYHIAVRRGCDVDQPRNLAKSVTVE
jgi:glucosamine--fructose-6-phosphate aminotransferase (isomerizing)